MHIGASLKYNNAHLQVLVLMYYIIAILENYGRGFIYFLSLYNEFGLNRHSCVQVGNSFIIDNV